MGVTFDTLVAFPSLRVPAAAPPRFRTAANGGCVNRRKAFARVALGAGAHSTAGPAGRADGCNLPGLHSMFGQRTPWA